MAGAGTAQVAYRVDGRPVEAKVEQPWFGRTVEIADQVRIEYLPSDRTLARRARAHNLLGFAVAAAVEALLALLRLPAPSSQLGRQPPPWRYRVSRRATRCNP